MGALCWATLQGTASPPEPQIFAGEPEAAPDPLLLEGSRKFLAEEKLSGVVLGMGLSELRALRPKLRRQSSADADGQQVYVEPLPGRQVLYQIDEPSQRLARVQVASALSGAESFLAHLEQRKARFGVPEGIVDCPASPGQLMATRRFVWREQEAGAMEVVHLRGERALVTFYVAALPTLADSLALAACTPTKPEDFANFPGSSQGAAH